MCARYHEEHPDATVRFSGGNGWPMAFAGGSFERAVDAVVENAFERHDGTTVWHRLRRAGASG